MAKIGVTLDVLNQKGTPALYTDIFANRPTYGYAGRLFFSTDTSAIYEDTGTAWTLLADAGILNVGTLEQVTTNGNTTDKGIVISANGLQTNSLNITSLTSGSVLFADGSGLIQQDNSNFFWDDTNNRLGIGTNTPGAPLDIHNSNAGTTTLQINNTASSNAYIAFQQNNVGHWRIGNTAASNTFDILNNDLGNTPFSINNSNNNITALGTITTNGFIKSGGTSAQFLKADGSIDSNTYLTTSSASSTYLPLTGGTLTGALTGTSATFSSSVTATYGYFSGTGASVFNSQVTLNNTTSSPSLITFQNTANVHAFGFTSTGTQRFTFINGALTEIASITSAGAATFSSSVTATYGYFSGTGASVFNSQVTLNNTTSSPSLITFQNTSNAYAFGFNSTGTQRFTFINGGLSEIASITGTGVATFSGSVNSASSALQINPTNGYNVLIGTTTDAGYKLQVNGTASVTQIITAQTWLNASTFNQSFTISPANGAGTTIISNNSTNYTWTLEPATGNNRLYILRTIGSNTITINTSGSDTIITNTNTSVSSLTMIAANGAIILQSDGSSRWLQIK